MCDISNSKQSINNNEKMHVLVIRKKLELAFLSFFGIKLWAIVQGNFQILANF